MYILASKKLPDTLASALTCLLIIAIVFIPLVFFVFALTDEALNLYQLGKRQPSRPETADFSPGKSSDSANPGTIAASRF